uniref:RRM domain-containing protein n=1 Tax=Panagrolaimus sp. ES5 TaxID=591445 RepID=A0AC34FDQ9_9BILA
MEQKSSETELAQQQQQPTKSDNEKLSKDNNQSIDEHQNETVDEILAHEAQNLGNWADVLAEDLPTLENGAQEEQSSTQAEQPPLPIAPEVYPHKLAIVRGSDLTLCQVPDSLPFNLLVFELPDAVTEEELYMLFGGKRAIECHMYRRDLREIIFSFRKRGHLIEALLKENMIFKEKPLRLAVIFFGYQIDKLHTHNQVHTEYDSKMIPFTGAFEKCHERLEDGTLSELFDKDSNLGVPFEMQPVVVSTPQPPPPPPPKKYSNDVRMSQSQYVHQNSVPGDRQRAGSITSVTSGKSVPAYGGSASISRQSSYQPSEKHHPNSRNTQNQQGVERQQSVPSAATSNPKRVIQRIPPKNNPFGDAKPVNTDKKVMTMIEQNIAQKSVEHQKNTPPPQTPQPSQPTSNQKHPELVQGPIRIQKRPEGMPPQNGQLQFTNSMYAQQHQHYRHQGPPPSHQQPRRPPPQHQQQQPRHQQQQQQQPSQPSMPYCNHVNLGDETIDVSKPPPPMFKKPDEKKQQRQPYNKRHSNYQNIPNGFSSNIQPHQSSHNYTSHQSLPPAPPSRRKSSADQRAASETIQTEKSQSAPASHETVAMSQTSPRSSPSYNSLKRPNSANSSMSFVTAHSGSEMSSAMSTDLPCIMDSADSITEKVSEVTDEQRRHSWEGQDLPGFKKDGPKKKYSFGSKRGGKRSNGNGEFRKPIINNANISRKSSASTPQFQSASDVSMDVNEGSQATNEKRSFNETLPEPDQKVALIKAKNGLEKRAPSLPLSRPHTSSNEKSTNPPQVDDSNKPDSMSAPPTPIGPNKKKSENRKSKDNKRSSKPNVLQNNKFSALMDAPMGSQ